MKENMIAIWLHDETLCKAEKRAAESGKTIQQWLAWLVRRELADARQCQLDRIVGTAGAGLRRPGEPLEQQAVLPHAQRAQADVTLEHLAGARVDHASAVGPAAGLAMDPLDDVVADVERMGVLARISHAPPRCVSMARSSASTTAAPSTASTAARAFAICSSSATNTRSS